MPQIASMALSFSFSKFSSSHSRGEASKQPHGVGDPGGAARAPRRECRPAAPATTASATPSSPKICGASCAERGCHRAPAFGVRRAETRDPAARWLRHFSPRRAIAVRKRRWRSNVRRCDEFQSVGEQAILVRGEKRRAGEHAQIHRVEVVTKTGPGDFAGLDRAAGRIGALDHCDLPALDRQDAARRPDR